jgi:hypothetical protein
MPNMRRREFITLLGGVPFKYFGDWTVVSAAQSEPNQQRARYCKVGRHLESGA